MISSRRGGGREGRGGRERRGNNFSLFIFYLFFLCLFIFVVGLCEGLCVFPGKAKARGGGYDSEIESRRERNTIGENKRGGKDYSDV